MRRDEYLKLRLVDMQKRRWRTTRVMRNGNIEIPAGTEVEIINKRGGLSLSSEACECCGVKVFITRVEPSAVAEIA